MATLTSAVKLEQEQQFLIAKKLQELTGSKNIKLKPVVDADLVAGFVVEYGSTRIDLSGGWLHAPAGPLPLPLPQPTCSPAAPPASVANAAAAWCLPAPVAAVEEVVETIWAGQQPTAASSQLWQDPHTRLSPP